MTISGHETFCSFYLVLSQNSTVGIGGFLRPGRQPLYNTHHQTLIAPFCDRRRTLVTVTDNRRRLSDCRLKCLLTPSFLDIQRFLLFCRKDNFHIYRYLYSNSDFWKSIFFYFCTSPDLSLVIKLEKLPESYKFKFPNNEKFLSAARYNRVNASELMSAHDRSSPHRGLVLAPARL